MTREYLLSIPEDLNLELGDTYAPEDRDGAATYLVANVPTEHAEIYAPEINFYLRFSDDQPETKMKNTEKLFDIRSTSFDYACDTTTQLTVGNRVAVVMSANPPEELISGLKQHELEPSLIAPGTIKKLTGSLGGFTITLDSAKPDEAGITVDQIVWPGAPGRLAHKQGVFDPDRIGLETTIHKLSANCRIHQVRKTKRYDRAICLLDRKHHDVCGACADVCPSGAIVRAGNERTLEFSDVDCTECGRCLGVCPSGALESTLLTNRAVEKIASFFSNTVTLLIPAATELDELQVRLGKNTLPLMIEQEGGIDEYFLLCFLMTSGRPMVIMAPQLPDAAQEAIGLINAIYGRLFNQQPLYLCRTAEEFRQAVEESADCQLVTSSIPDPSDLKRKNISRLLARILNEREAGTIVTGPHLHYGDMIISQQACTLCLSCAEACPVEALKPFAEDNTLRFNPSLCTNCGYCETICPEPGCLHTVDDFIALAPRFFTYRVMASDTLTRCVECGAPIGPSKSLEKIAAIMKPLFADDPNRLRTLSCCPDCKAKVMITAMRP